MFLEMFVEGNRGIRALPGPKIGTGAPKVMELID